MSLINKDKINIMQKMIIENPKFNLVVLNFIRTRELIKYLNYHQYYVVYMNSKLFIFPREYINEIYETMPSLQTQLNDVYEVPNGKTELYNKWKIQPNYDHIFQIQLIVKIVSNLRKRKLSVVIDNLMASLKRDRSKTLQKYIENFLIQKGLNENKMLRPQLHNELTYLPPYSKKQNYSGLGLLNKTNKYNQAMRSFNNMRI